MTQLTNTRPLPMADQFQTDQVVVVAGGHLIHDIFTSFIAPLLPLIIPKLNLSLTLAGTLASFQQFPSLINPLLGLLADRGNMRWLVILAPTISAVCMSLIGLAPCYAALALLLFTTGLAIAVWHTNGPAMIARVAGRQVGLGMSFFMLGGSLAYATGPLLAVAAVSWWGLEGIWRLMPLGLAASVLLYWRTRRVSVTRAAPRANGTWTESWRALRRVMLPLACILILQGFMLVSLSTYLPTLLSREGANLWQAGSSLALVEMAGAAGSFLTGTLSDRLGRRRVLILLALLAPALMLAFLQTRGWVIVPALLAVGLVAFSATPVMMALVQEHSRDHPATANGLFFAINFASKSFIIIAVGALADRIGLRSAFYAGALLALAALPFALSLPQTRHTESP